MYSSLATVYSTTIPLGSCAAFAIHAATSVAFNGVQTSVAIGNVGVAPGTSITGNYVLGSGTVQDNSVLANSCAADKLIAYNTAAAAICTNLLAVSDLSGMTLYPGVYCTGSGYMTITASTVTLDGQGNSNAVWIFQTASSLSTSTGTSFILQNGAQASNVFWQVGSNAALGVSSSFVGTILSLTGISFDSSSVITGRALAQTAVTFASGNTVTSFVTSGRYVI
jgi:hypothetical protein